MVTVTQLLSPRSPNRKKSQPSQAITWLLAFLGYNKQLPGKETGSSQRGSAGFEKKTPAVGFFYLILQSLHSTTESQYNEDPALFAWLSLARLIAFLFVGKILEVKLKIR